MEIFLVTSVKIIYCSLFKIFIFNNVRFGKIRLTEVPKHISILSMTGVHYSVTKAQYNNEKYSQVALYLESGLPIWTNQFFLCSFGN